MTVKAGRKKTQGNPVLFLDRDGTINVDMGPQYLNDPDNAKLIPGAGKAIVRAKNAGFRVAIITNQAGVAKGITPRDALPLIHKHLEGLIALEGGVPAFRFDDIRVCIHHPNDRCACRKPEPKNLEESMKDLDADVSTSFFVGDKSSDLLCAQRVGMRSILVLTGHGLETQAEIRDTGEAKPDAIVESLREAVQHAINEVFKGGRKGH
jgi:histidinol-phosphate phosphatase family protein